MEGTYFAAVIEPATVTGDQQFKTGVQLYANSLHPLYNKNIEFWVYYPSETGWAWVATGSTGNDGWAYFYPTPESNFGTEFQWMFYFRGDENYAAVETATLDADISWVGNPQPGMVDVRITWEAPWEATPYFITHVGEVVILNATVTYSLELFGKPGEWTPARGATIRLYKSDDPEGPFTDQIGVVDADDYGNVNFSFKNLASDPPPPTGEYTTYYYKAHYDTYDIWDDADSIVLTDFFYYQDTTTTSISCDDSSIIVGEPFIIKVSSSYGMGGNKPPSGLYSLYWKDASQLAYGGWKFIQSINMVNGVGEFSVTEKAVGTNRYYVELSQTNYYTRSASNILQLGTMPSTEHGTLYPETPDFARELVWLVPVTLTDTGYVLQELGTNYENAVFINTLDIQWKHPPNWESIDVPGRNVPVNHFLGGGAQGISFSAIERGDTSIKNRDLLRTWNRNGQPLQFNSTYHYESTLVIIKDYTLSYLDDWRWDHYSEYSLELAEYEPLKLSWESIDANAIAKDCEAKRAAGSYTTPDAVDSAALTWLYGPDGQCYASLGGIVRSMNNVISRGGTDWNNPGKATGDWVRIIKEDISQGIYDFMVDLGCKRMYRQTFQNYEIWTFDRPVPMDSASRLMVWASNDYWQMHAIDSGKETNGVYDEGYAVAVRYSSPLVVEYNQGW